MPRSQPRDERALKAAVDQSAAVLTAAGFPRMPARVLMALLVEDGGLTASELGERVGVSAAAISGAVRYLEQLGILHRVPVAGSRRDRWEFLDDAWYAALVSKSSIYGVIADLGDRAADAIGDEAHHGARRARDMARFYRFVEQKMPELLAEWETEREA
ncbi:GbsR/MarR family transcriptional regulator [Agromyces larvae]|uniref:MarR family transcriptional regulator n=1 Tax=Agromyces larvae TaxID=2929802 RepID=A0ABY4BYF9_9MICO|nr:helix-turn-helix domain-containing protein [Agromyces larvae]UOE43769.1 MarR family transcriptional regulator [Agromyces larvae]